VYGLYSIHNGNTFIDKCVCINGVPLHTWNELYTSY